MFMEKSLTGRFDGLIEYSSQINRLNGGTGMALTVIQHDRVVVEHYEGTHSRGANSRPVQADSQFNIASARADLPQNGFLWYVKGGQAALSEIGDTLPNGTCQILGVTGPLVLVIPTHDTVVVRMYNKHGNYGGPDGSQWLQYLKDFGDQVMRTVQYKTQLRTMTPTHLKFQNIFPM